jgi:hypothetical protein
VTPLSTTLDSIGPLANSVACCAVADAILAGEPPIVPPAIPVASLRLGVPQTHVLDGLEAEVATAFAGACTMLSCAGARIADLPLSELGELPAINASGGFAPIEAYAWHKPLLERRGGEYDPRVTNPIIGAVGRVARARVRRAHRRWGTDGSNPSPSTGESDANLTSSRGAGNPVKKSTWVASDSMAHLAAIISGENSPLSPDELRSLIATIGESASNTLVDKLGGAVAAVRDRERLLKSSLQIDEI